MTASRETSRRLITMQVVNTISTKQLIWDSKTRGFGLRCQQSKKIYLLKYRFNGRQRWYSIGEHGAPWTPDLARKEAERLWGEIRSGKDISANREARRARPKIADLCVRYLEEHAREHKKASSVLLDERNIKNHVLPILGDSFVDEVTRADIDRFKRTVREGTSCKPSDGRKTGFRGGKLPVGGHAVANRCLALLSKMFNLAERWEWCKEHTNPVRHVEKYREQKRERYLSPEEFRRLGEALSDAILSKSETLFVVGALRLLVLTGARLNEILTLRWEDVYLKDGILKLPDSKTGKKTIWLNTPAIAVLEGIPRVAGNPFVIVGERDGAHLINLRKPWRRICKACEIVDVRVHDLRHSYASVAVGSGLSLHIVGKTLGHLRASTTERYAHLADAPVREANELVGRKLSESFGVAEKRTGTSSYPDVAA